MFAVPGDLATPTGGYAYDRRIIAELPALGWRAQVLDLGDGFPRRRREIRAAACAKLAALPPRPPGRDRRAGLRRAAGGRRGAAASHPLVALVHHPLALESGLSAERRQPCAQSERAALACARRVVATSAATARLLAADYGVASDRLAVVEPGTDRAAACSRARAARSSLCSRSARWCRARATTCWSPRSRGSRICPGGSSLRAIARAARRRCSRLEADIARFGLADRVTLRGAVAAQRLAALYASADLFVLPSRFEGYGMAYAEAIAHGVPVVGTTAGAIPETVPAGAGVLVPPDDVEALAAALRRLIEQPDERRRLAAGARALAFPSWREQAALFARVLERVA